MAGVNWYVDTVVATIAGLKLNRSKLIGFYWSVLATLIHIRATLHLFYSLPADCTG